MADILKKILQQKKKDLIELKNRYGQINLSTRDKKIIPFENVFSSSDKIRIIAEIKPASPSEGIIISEAEIPEIAKIYNEADIVAISVLTDENFFSGKYENLKIVSSLTNKPVLCKDFIIDKYQIDLAYINNADAILLIVEALNENILKKLYDYAVSLGLGVLVEFHYAENISIINNNCFKLVGINNRNLKTMTVDINNSITLKKEIKNNIPVISESGIFKAEDLIRLHTAGFKGALIGTSILKSYNIKKTLNDLINYNKKRSLL